MAVRQQKQWWHSLRLQCREYFRLFFQAVHQQKRTWDLRQHIHCQRIFQYYIDLAIWSTVLLSLAVEGYVLCMGSKTFRKSKGLKTVNTVVPNTSKIVNLKRIKCIRRQMHCLHTSVVLWEQQHLWIATAVCKGKQERPLVHTVNMVYALFYLQYICYKYNTFFENLE